MIEADLGGDSPCWAHIFDDEDGHTASTQDCGPLVVDLGVAAPAERYLVSMKNGGGSHIDYFVARYLMQRLREQSA